MRVKSLIKNGTDLLFQQQKTILSGAIIIASMMLVSALLGLVKVRLYAGILGVGPEFDTFVAAFKIPDLVFQLLIVGSLNSAFIPIFSDFIGRNEAKKAWQFASSILNLFFLALTTTSIFLFVFARPVSLLVAAGFPPAQQNLLIQLMRIMLLSPIFLGISSIIAGSLQSFQRFLVPFLSPIAYNLGGIFGVLFLYKILGLPGLAWGIVLGSLLHLLIQLPLLRHLGFKYSLVLGLKETITRKMVFLALPRTLGLAAEQIKTVILINLASLLAAGSISLFRFGESIQTLPISVFGIAIAQASLPTLARQAKNPSAFKHILASSLLQMLYLTIPVSVILIVLKIPVVRLVLGVGKFDWPATVNTSWILALFAISIFAQAGNALLIRAFYALQETKLPVVISMLTAILTIILSVILLPYLQIRALPLAISVGALLEFTSLLLLLEKRLFFIKEKLFVPAAKIFFAAAIMAVFIYVPVKTLDQVFIDTTRVVNLIILVWLVLSFGGTSYLFLTFILGCKEIRIFLRLLWKLRNWREALVSARKLPPTSQTPLLDEHIEG